MPARFRRPHLRRPDNAFADAMIQSLGFKPEGKRLPQQDPAMGRGYRIGHLLPCAPMAGLLPGVPRLLLANHSHIEVVTPFKLVLGVLDEDGNDPGPKDGSHLRFRVVTSVENDRVLRIADVSLGNSQVLYVNGRAINIEVENPQGFTLQAQMAMDEWSPGVATWQVQEVFVGLAVETPLDIPPFCQQFRVYTPTAMTAPRLRGYAAGGVVVIDMPLTVPDSTDIERVPGLDYTLDMTIAPSNHAVNFQCFG
mgnify:CR=1 FL=1